MEAQNLTSVKNLMGAMRASGRTELDSISTQLLLREEYDKAFGICQHDDRRRPLSLVAVHDKESVARRDPMTRLAKRFETLDIGKRFNCSFFEFIKQPRHMVELLFQVAEESMSRDHQSQDKMAAAVEADLRAAK